MFSLYLILLVRRVLRDPKVSSLLLAPSTFSHWPSIPRPIPSSNAADHACLPPCPHAFKLDLILFLRIHPHCPCPNNEPIQAIVTCRHLQPSLKNHVSNKCSASKLCPTSTYNRLYPLSEMKQTQILAYHRHRTQALSTIPTTSNQAPAPPRLFPLNLRPAIDFTALV